MAQGGLKVAAEAAGAGGARQQKPPTKKEWYTIVVYEKPRSKTVVLYLGKEMRVFNVSADINVGNIAVIMRRWRVSDKTVACSASIHAINLAKLIKHWA